MKKLSSKKQKKVKYIKQKWYDKPVPFKKIKNFFELIADFSPALDLLGVEENKSKSLKKKINKNKFV